MGVSQAELVPKRNLETTSLNILARRFLRGLGKQKSFVYLMDLRFRGRFHLDPIAIKKYH
ncbi:hypothetical protein FC96_GL002412 [Secundilactobacillus kimchicus JCM 15530]|uniref:Uncharacterized protein n=1 Tax=Secundilactobacillus kimchicus JCM 15530 TaxID=1302272 RepID=A0A0R1HM59_9LACO|nr:hypothetical protein FC96_GL002412 [Secundilactobacillus kimchicus JCM 15530]